MALTDQQQAIEALMVDWIKNRRYVICDTATNIPAALDDMIALAHDRAAALGVPWTIAMQEAI